MKTTIFALFAVLLANNVEVKAGNGKRDDQKKKAVRSAPASNKDSKTKDTAEQTKNVRTSNGGGGQKDQKESQQKKNDNEKKSNAGNSKKQVTADNAVMETVKNDDTDLPTYLPTYLPTPLMPTASPTLDLYYVAGKADKNISLGGSKVGKGSKSGGGYVWMDTNAPTTYIPVSVLARCMNCIVCDAYLTYFVLHSSPCSFQSRRRTIRLHLVLLRSTPILR